MGALRSHETGRCDGDGDGGGAALVGWSGRASQGGDVSAETWWQRNSPEVEVEVGRGQGAALQERLERGQAMRPRKLASEAGVWWQ